jgi:hypothetical protein
VNAIEITLTTVGDSAVWVSAVLGALALTWRFVIRPVIAFGQRLEHVMESVEEQLYPNHGTSLRDAVIRIEECLGIEPVLPAVNPPESRRKENP